MWRASVKAVHLANRLKLSYRSESWQTDTEKEKGTNYDLISFRELTINDKSFYKHYLNLPEPKERFR